MNKSFLWSACVVEAFNNLKRAFTPSSPTLAQYLDPAKPFIQERDAFDFTLGNVLSQDQDEYGQINRIAYQVLLGPKHFQLTPPRVFGILKD